MVLWKVLIILILWIKIFRFRWEYVWGCHDPIYIPDNVPVHTARNVQTWLAEHDVQVIQWPAQSPDLNVIENVWSVVKNRVMRDRPWTKLEPIPCLFRDHIRLSTQTLEFHDTTSYPCYPITWLPYLILDFEFNIEVVIAWYVLKLFSSSFVEFQIKYCC